MWNSVYEGWLALCKRVRARVSGFSNASEIREISRCLHERLKKTPLPADPSLLKGADRALYDRILSETRRQNRNNVTRTTAYWEIFQRAPELHWALLAHMVSRNGGYNMTDLRGDLLPRMMEGREAEQFFQFLERANFLIFGDAYPQLLLYEASRDAGKPLFHLLPYFGVSQFMSIVWERFWETNDSELLTMALVVNEQNYIEHRVVRNPKYLPVMNSFEFKAQTILNLTQVVFPYQSPYDKPKVQLAGVTVATFLSLTERIDTGRRLYAILFGKPEVYDGVLKWAERTPHTASRADYWPHLYTPKRQEQEQSEQRYSPRLNGLFLKKGALPLHSPPLGDAWPDVENPEPPGGHDWCRSADAAKELYGTRPGKNFNLTAACAKTLAMIEKAVAAETWWDGNKQSRE
ncbi:DUF2515 family protein [Tumebacillus flagellatus]|uniref:DUF2515 domain-containing protein n=1 Tax=Tumebacillus flagellatus TaxID=1157490 RepID=A0A074LQN6_9BACL|nr:DUF2515 family protein [Tumebacillus flagellatus]KEO83419.1 hypothetical protein EL26_10625 [Tumebacillus flagellatus]